jgi:hypothetical protein
MEVNFAQDNNKASDEVFVPLYHTVQEKEGLFRISQAYNKVPPDHLKSWNKLSTETVSSGTTIIVGYLKVKKELSPLAGATVTVPATPALVKTVLPKEEPKKQAAETEKKEEPKKTEAVKQDHPVLQPKTEAAVKISEGGFFGKDYLEQTSNGKKVQTGTGNAGIFKSTSGWTDSKYYALINNVTPGTIVKVSSLGKTVYAKVLGAMPVIKQNEGLLIRISNAAAKALNAGDQFTADLSWDK